MKALLTASLLFLCAQALPAQQPNEAARIDSYCRPLEVLFGKPATHTLWLASNKEDALGATSPEPWPLFSSQAAVTKLFDTSTDLNAAAEVLVHEGHVAIARAQAADSSGDWMLSATYCFAPDGKLQKISSTYNTFYGDISARRQFYFAADGKIIHETVRFLPLDSDKPVAHPGADFIDGTVPVFLSVARSPFRTAEGP